MNLFSELLSSGSISGKKKNNAPIIQSRRGIEIKSSREIEIMRKSGQIV